MFIHSIHSALGSLQKADQAATKLGQQLTTGKKIQSPQDDPATWKEAGRADSTSTYLDAIHGGLTELSTNLAVAGTDIQAIGQYLSAMQGQLQQALNVPAGDPSRQIFLQNYNQVWQQINQTVNTTTQAGARTLLSGGDIQALIGLNGAIKTVHGQEMDTGPNGLNIAALDPRQATETDLRTALASLTEAQSTLAARMMGLGADAADINAYAGQTAQSSLLYQAQVDSLTSADPTEAALELQSVNVQHSLANETLAGISNDRSAVLRLLQ